MRTPRALVALSVAAVVGLVPVAAFARHGADDPKSHVAGDDQRKVIRVIDRSSHDDPVRHGSGEKGSAKVEDRRERSGHDDPLGDDHGEHGEHGDDHGGR